MKKSSLITGANSGLGFETAKKLLKENYKLILACRNLDKAEEAKKELLKSTTAEASSVEIVKLDLADFSSIESASEHLKNSIDQLDVLVNNAGVMIPPYQTTEQGFELQFGVNYLGHFYLTGLLMPLLKQSEAARVVTLSSLAHKWGDIYFVDINFQNGYSKRKAYGQSKLACLMFAYELDRRLKTHQPNIKSFAAHPGLSNTNLMRFLPTWLKVISPVLMPLLSQDAANGARPITKAVLDKKLKGGEYLGPSGFNEYKGKPEIVDSNTISKDFLKAKRLWDLSEEYCQFEYL